MLIILVLKKVFEPGPVNAHRIIGSIVIYMLLANVWGILYLFLFNQIEGFFQLTEPQFKINSELANLCISATLQLLRLALEKLYLFILLRDLWFR